MPEDNYLYMDHIEIKGEISPEKCRNLFGEKADRLSGKGHDTIWSAAGGSRKIVRYCTIKNCNLYPYRQEPTRERIKPPKGQLTMFEPIAKEA